MKVDASLYSWCCNLRKARKHPEKHILKLTTDRIKALDSVGFDWGDQRAVVKTVIECSQDPPSSSNLTGGGNSEKEESRFQYRLKQLLAHKDQHGHLNVNVNKYNSLYKWCAKMRNARKYPEKYNRKLTTEHIAALDSVGFVWTSKELMSFTDRIKQLQAYKAQHGHLDVTTVEDKSLYTFCYNLRRKKHENRITADRIAALDSIGFDWKSGFVSTSKKPMSFTDRIKQLRAYKAQHGHLDVTTVEDKSLYTWCAKLRTARRHPEKCNRNLTADRIAALDSIGFDWKSDNTIAADVVARRHSNQWRWNSAWNSLWTELTIPPGKMGLRISTVDAIVGGATISTIHDTCTFRDHISVGDVILEINGMPVRTVEMFTLGMDKPRNITVIRKSI
jgi:hypothetical protein